MRRTKIVCTIGPASCTVEQLDRLAAAGMDVARLNFSHGTHAEHADVIRRIRDAEARWNRPVAILQDLQGPKIRLGTFGEGGGRRVDLEAGRPFTLCRRPCVGTSERVFVSPPEYLERVKTGDEIWMDDGMIQLRVEATTPHEVRCVVGAVDAVMVARGDLGVDVPLEDVPHIQKEIIRQAHAAKVPVIVATQMLESMVTHMRPTRAEVADVTAAIFDTADAIMLSAETASGRYPAEAVEVMARIAERAEQAALTQEPTRRRRENRAPVGFPEAVSDAAASAARALDARAIVAFTQSGFSARLISQERPATPIIAFTPFSSVQRRLALTWGVTSRLIRKVETTDEMVEEIEATLLGDGTVRADDVLVIISGSPMWVTGTTNLMKIHRVGERR